MDQSSLLLYCNTLTGKLYKILPLWESKDKGDLGAEMYQKYIKSLAREMIGAIETYPILNEEVSYISIINTLNFLRSNEITHSECRFEVFKMIHQLEQVNSNLEK